MEDNKRNIGFWLVLFSLLFCYKETSAFEISRQHSVVKDTIIWSMPITDIQMKRDGDLLTVGMELKLADYKLKGDKVTLFTPVLINETDTLDLNSVGLYGRMRYIQYLRDLRNPVGGENELSYRYSKRPETIFLKQSLPFDEWMNGATLYIRKADYGCCHTLLEDSQVSLARWYETTYVPDLEFVVPTKEIEKKRQLNGRAYIDFPVNLTEIYPEYRNNPAELRKIIATIDSVKNDSDVFIDKITIKGYASPEGSWENNIRLAKGRTETLKKYVKNLYDFDESLLHTDFEPEDWEGLKEFIMSSGLEHKTEILEIIDDADILPDPKDALIKSKFPNEYEFLLNTVYPALRHSDYTIDYTIRQYNNPDEIKVIYAESPQKLSLNEIYSVANELEPGSMDYNNVYTTAVLMYPHDEIANLNAANVAMQRNDLENAERYLSKAGESDAAQYARGVLATINGDYSKALEFFNRAALTMPSAVKAFEEISHLLNDF